MTEAGLIEELYRKNVEGLFEEKEFKERMGIVSRRENAKDKSVGNVVLEGTGKAISSLVNEGRVFVGWGCLRVREYDSVNRCYACFSYGHRLRECKEKGRICRKCGNAGHMERECKGNEECRNCRMRGRECGHSVMSDRWRDTEFGWQVCPDWGISDHNVVLITARSVREDRMNVEEPRWNIRKVDWKEYARQIRVEAERTAFGEYKRMNVERKIACITEWVNTVNERMLHRVSKRKMKGVGWWTEELNVLKRRVRKMRARHQRVRKRGDVVATEMAARECRVIVKQYKSLIREEKERLLAETWTLLRAKRRDEEDANEEGPWRGWYIPGDGEECVLGSIVPVWGKILERMLVNRLNERLVDSRSASQYGFRGGRSTEDAWCKVKECDERLVDSRSASQYGFRGGRSTEDAWCKVKECANGTACKYVLGIFVDFKGAFDNLRWDRLLAHLRVRQPPLGSVVGASESFWMYGDG
ncbi:hypothetical protein QE152_g5684 [Popillia japonica]|uniref:CCHC-type domain-containing protein n=1 Tax=Popillia japonica TaxID=7064 RepID=A0AAW1MMQ2_POPJA